MKILCMDHIGVAVKNLDEVLDFYTEVLGLQSAGLEEVDEQKARTAFIPVGDTEIELLESTSPEGPIAKFIEKRGEGIHHIALRVEDLGMALEELKRRGVQLIDQSPRYGAGGAKIAFIHPKATKGVLLELSEREQRS